jgi:hypothetical protein
MISLQTLAVLTPVVALIMVSGYGWFEHRRIEQARKAEERELASASYEAASTHFDGDKPASESWRRVEVLRSSDVKPSTTEPAEKLLAEMQRITVQLQGVLGSRSTAKS